MQPSSAPPVDPEILAELRSRAGGGDVVGFDAFMDVALYHPAAGYYRRDRRRVGFGSGTDFFTATSSPLFGRLVTAACVGLLAPAEASDFEFVEIGSEPGAGILGGLPHPFASARQVPVGQPIRIKGPSVVFSNELFDAQPFRRFRFRQGRWREIGVSFAGGLLQEEELAAAAPMPAVLPEVASEGYVIDAPLASAELAGMIAGQQWSGLFLAFDYGKSWEEIAHATPSGTGRAYHLHVQGNDLLTAPGEQDLTCHVCWDWLSDALAARGFAAPHLESQEAFFVRHCAGLIESLATAPSSGLSRDKLSLMHLLHPANMGQKFQALWAIRSGSPA